MSTLLNDVKNAALLGVSRYPQTVTASDSGDTIDCISADGNCFATQLIGTVSGTSPTLAGKIMESSDGSTWTDVSGATFTTVSASNNAQTIVFQRTKRYLRHTTTVGGTTPSFGVAVLIGEQLKTV